MKKVEKKSKTFFRQNGFQCIRYDPDRFQTSSRTPEHGFGPPFMPRMNFYTFFEIRNFDHKIDFLASRLLYMLKNAFGGSIQNLTCLSVFEFWSNPARKVKMKTISNFASSRFCISSLLFKKIDFL